MITIYKNDELILSIINEPIPGCWINVIDPTPEEIMWLTELTIPQDYITYPLDIDERARMEHENGEILIVLRVPIYIGDTADIPYSTMPLGIIINQQHLVTVCKHNNDIIDEFTRGKVRGIVTAKRNRFVLQILHSTANKYLNYLREITKSVDALEDQLQQSTRNKEVLELLKYQKCLTYFTTALKSNELMMERLQRLQFFKAYPDDEDLLEDALTENQQAIEMTNIASNILSSMMDAFASIISNNLNMVMKLLAAITIVLSLPTMVASFFGMNVHLPFENIPYAFLFTLGISFVLSLLVLYLFYRRDWL